MTTQTQRKLSTYKGSTLSRPDDPVFGLWWRCQRPGEDACEFPLCGIEDAALALPAARHYRRPVYHVTLQVTFREDGGPLTEPLTEPRSYREDEGVYVLVGPDGEDVATFQPERVRAFR